MFEMGFCPDKKHVILNDLFGIRFTIRERREYMTKNKKDFIMTEGTMIDMEMQVAPFEYWEKRVLFYIGKMYVRQIREGGPYEKLKKCTLQGGF
jgi:hypothetical protein